MIRPLAASIIAIVPELLHVPPEVELANVVVAPTHTDVVPVMFATDALFVTYLIAKHAALVL